MLKLRKPEVIPCHRLHDFLRNTRVLLFRLIGGIVKVARRDRAYKAQHIIEVDLLRAVKIIRLHQKKRLDIFLVIR